MSTQDPTTPNSRDRKKMVVFVSPKMLADLRLKVNDDSLTISEFLRNVILGYLNGDLRIAEFMRDVKKLLGRQSHDAQNRVLRHSKEGQKILDEFELSEQDKKQLFDIFESGDNF